MSGILITGASGFIGRQMVGRLLAEGQTFSIAGRTNPFGGFSEVRFIAIDTIGPNTDWSIALDGCASIIHLAAKVPSPKSDESLFETVNAQGTARLVQMAKVAGVRKIVFASSIFAVTAAANDHLIGDESPPHPATAYGRSKLAAEAEIAGFANQERTAISLRLPMIYGPTATGNWRRLLRLSALPVPLPFGAAQNCRSMLAIENAVDAILHAHANATPDKSGAYAVSEGPAPSLTEMLTVLRKAAGRSPNLFPLPPFLLRLLLVGLGKSAMADSLLGSLAIDGNRFTRTFGWRPVIDTNTALAASARLHP